jgi:hypothetical protein
MRTDRSLQSTVVERAGIKVNPGLKEELFQPARLADFPYEKLVPPGERATFKP